MDIEKILKRDWYIQGFNANPIFLNSGGISGFEMQKKLGFSYTMFLYNYKDGYGEMEYLNSDFIKIWLIIKNKIKSNNNYVWDLKEQYDKIFTKHKKLFSKINGTNLTKISDKKLLELLKKCIQAQTDSVGLAHIIEPISMEGEKEFKKNLSKQISNNADYNKYLSFFTTPVEKSFLTQEEDKLRRISKLPAKNQSKALKNHLKEFFWINNSFANSVDIGISDIKNKLTDLKANNGLSIKSQDKIKLAKKLGFCIKFIDLINLIDFITSWQDQRKANAMIAVGFLDKIVGAISNRVKIDRKYLLYLTKPEINNFESIGNISQLKNDLILRSKGVFYILTPNQQVYFTGADYQKIINKQKEINSFDSNNYEIHGTIANPGTARGNAIICKNLDSIDKVKDGDIIVASMTRPEFIPALKKAAGIVTDEGGITCHAAIVARELNIPCIIGTKIATKILRDGDIIEVRANHGIVRKIIK